jgi:DNA repair exonuclease SbcCD ATPase subunit
VRNTSLPGHIEIKAILPDKNAYTELFERQIKENAQDEADVVVKQHFAKHRYFIEQGLGELPSDYFGSDCPFCMRPLSGVSNLIEYYRSVFDKTYEEEKQKYLNDIKSMQEKLESSKVWLINLPGKVMSVFDYLEKLKHSLGVKEIYKMEEKESFLQKFGNLPVSLVDKLIDSLKAINAINQEPSGFMSIYDEADSLFKSLTVEINKLNQLINDKNKKLTEFKNQCSNENNLISEMETRTNEINDRQAIISFLSSNNIETMINQRIAQSKLEELKTWAKADRDKLESYLSNATPANFFREMQSIQDKFKLNFTLEPDRRYVKTKEYTFSFKIKDKTGQYRDMKDGLSEGERQIISLAFFFAINRNIPDKQNSILVFDDPIINLDPVNIKILADLLIEQMQNYSQIIVLTHHPLFHKYLTKNDNNRTASFGLSKKPESSGGSSICFYENTNPIEELKSCRQVIKEKVRAGVKPGDLRAKYKNLLSLAIERFVKHDILSSGKEKTHDNIMETLKDSRARTNNIPDEDLTALDKIYRYCRQPDSPEAGKDILSSLNELLGNIKRFLDIYEKRQVPDGVS